MKPLCRRQRPVSQRAPAGERAEVGVSPPGFSRSPSPGCGSPRQGFDVAGGPQTRIVCPALRVAPGRGDPPASPQRVSQFDHDFFLRKELARPDRFRQPQGRMEIRRRRLDRLVSGPQMLFCDLGSCKGKTVTVFAEGTAHPFLANPPIRGVRVDHQGNAWIRMETGNTSRHVLLPAPSPPPVRLKIATDDNGFAHVEFRPPDTDLEWQVAEGPWRRVPPDVRELGYLPPGHNRINVRLVDARLNVLPLSLSVFRAPRTPRLTWPILWKFLPADRPNAGNLPWRLSKPRRPPPSRFWTMPWQKTPPTPGGWKQPGRPVNGHSSGEISKLIRVMEDWLSAEK